MPLRAPTPRPVASLLALVLATTWLGAQAGTATADTSSVDDVSRDAAAAPSTLRFTRNGAYVVSTKVRGKVVRGRATLPSGLDRSSAVALPARDVLGSRSVEVLVDHGIATDGSYAHVYALFTHHRGSLRQVSLGGEPLFLATYTEGGDEGGFRCARGRLLLHWFHYDSAQGEQTSYRLAGHRLEETRRATLDHPIRMRRTSCG